MATYKNTKAKSVGGKGAKGAARYTKGASQKCKNCGKSGSACKC